MKRFFLAHPLLVGAILGVCFFAATEVLAAGIRSLWMPPNPTSSQQWVALLLVLLGALKTLFFGIALGRICGVAAREWILGKREETRQMLFTAGWIVVGIYGMLLMFSVAELVNLFLNSSLSPEQKTQQALEIIFFTFPLQVAILLLVLSRHLPAKSAQTTQITQNLRL